MADASSRRLGFIGAFPLMVLVVLVYNMFVFFWAPLVSVETADPELPATTLQKVEQVLGLGFDLYLISGDSWRLTIGALLLVLSLVLLLIEVIRATDTGSSAIMNHAFSMLLFIVCLVEFIVLQGFGTSVFFLITAMTLFDVVAGFTVGIVAARRDFGGGGIVVGGDR